LRFLNQIQQILRPIYITVVEDRQVRKTLSSMQSSTFGENYNAPCSAVSPR